MERGVPADDLATLLRQWSDTQLAALDAQDSPVEEAARSGSLLRPPATEAEVLAAERRLGTRFPPSYRSFLLLSDGAYGDTMGPVTNSLPGEPSGFLPAADVRWFRDVEPEVIEIWTQAQDQISAAAAGAEPAPPFEWSEVLDHRPMRDALLIAPGFDANCTLLVPVGDPLPDDEWEVWDHYKEGSSRWSSFHAFLHDVVESQLGIDADAAEVGRLLAAAQAGDQRASIDLGRVRSHEATGSLLDAARQDIALSPVLQALGRIGGAEVVAFLIGLELGSWQDRERQRTLASIGTPDALDHLVTVGACYELARVGDPRAADVAAAQLRSTDDVSTVVVAAGVLRTLPEPRWVPDLIVALDRARGDQVRVTVLGALQACGADDVVRRRAPELLDGPYGHAARAMLDRLSGA